MPQTSGVPLRDRVRASAGRGGWRATWGCGCGGGSSSPAIRSPMQSSERPFRGWVGRADRCPGLGGLCAGCAPRRRRRGGLLCGPSSRSPSSRRPTSRVPTGRGVAGGSDSFGPEAFSSGPALRVDGAGRRNATGTLRYATPSLGGRSTAVQGLEAIPTIGALRCCPPMEPRNGASPKANTPPSRATVQ